MEKGKIYEIVWDNGCFNCDNNCAKNLETYSVFNSSLSQKYENCIDATCSEDSTACEPKIYITWFGTDKNKRQLKTAGLAMTKFKSYSIKSLYSSIKGMFK